MMNGLDNEVFALRNSESIRVQEEKPDSGRFIAVMVRSVEMPDGPRSPVRSMDGAPVVQAAIVAAEWSPTNGNWHWLCLSQPSKEFIGDLLIDANAERDRWYFAVITDLLAK